MCLTPFHEIVLMLWAFKEVSRSIVGTVNGSMHVKP